MDVSWVKEKEECNENVLICVYKYMWTKKREKDIYKIKSPNGNTWCFMLIHTYFAKLLYTQWIIHCTLPCIQQFFLSVFPPFLLCDAIWCRKAAPTLYVFMWNRECTWKICWNKWTTLIWMILPTRSIAIAVNFLYTIIKLWIKNLLS